MRSLAKHRKDRRPHYAALSRDLRPFASVAPTPATLWWRIVASVVDGFLQAALLFPLMAVLGLNLAVFFPLMYASGLSLGWAPMNPPAILLGSFLAFALDCSYFALFEGFLGASPGILEVFVDHYNGHRPHRALSLAPPEPRRPTPTLSASCDARILRRDRLGGVVHEYVLAA